MQSLNDLRIFYNHTIHPELMRMERRRHRLLLFLGFSFLLLLFYLPFSNIFIATCYLSPRSIFFKGRGTDAALEQIDILKRTGVTPTSHMFNVCLQILIDENKHDAAEKLWIRMHWEEFNLTKESFTTMMRMCIKKGRYHIKNYFI